MLPLKYLLVSLGIVLFGTSGALVAYDIYLSSQLRRLLGRRRRQNEATTEPAAQRLSVDVDRPLRPVRWRLAQPLRAVNSRQFTADSFRAPSSVRRGRDLPPRPSRAGDGTETQRRQAAEWKGFATLSR
jgi:hypothetical protein